MPLRRAIALVAAGGAVGGLGRAAVGRLVPHDPGTWGWSTLLVNALGAFLLTALLARRPAEPRRLLLGTGLLGAFTTFSGFAVDAVLLADAGRPGTAAAYVLVSLATLLGAAVLGTRAVRR
jgi:CrcB protein